MVRVESSFIGKFLKFDKTATYGLWTSKNFLPAAPATVTSCPFQGLHRMIHYKQPECQGYIQSGCNGTSTMEVYSPCSSQPRK